MCSSSGALFRLSLRGSGPRVRRWARPLTGPPVDLSVVASRELYSLYVLNQLTCIHVYPHAVNVSSVQSFTTIQNDGVKRKKALTQSNKVTEDFLPNLKSFECLSGVFFGSTEPRSTPLREQLV